MSSQQRNEDHASILDGYLASRARKRDQDEQASNLNLSRCHRPQHPTKVVGGQASHPTAQLIEDVRTLRLCIDLPGVDVRDISVTIQRGVLHIRGDRKTWSIKGEVIKKLKFERRFVINTGVVDVQHARANLTKGVLVVTAPKKSEPLCIRVPVIEVKEDPIQGQPAASGQELECREEQLQHKPRWDKNSEKCGEFVPSVEPSVAMLPLPEARDSGSRLRALVVAADSGSSGEKQSGPVAESNLQVVTR